MRKKFNGHEKFYLFLLERNILDDYIKLFNSYKSTRYLGKYNQGKNIGENISIKKFLDLEKKSGFINKAFPFNGIYLSKFDINQKVNWRWVDDDWKR